jgi:hypothetical protein
MDPKNIQGLLSDLCIELGCCISPLAAQSLIENPPQSADVFAIAVLEAEGCDDLHAGRQVREMVAARFRRWEEEAAKSDLIDELSRYAPKNPEA